jgi:hypothetical protein
MMNEVELKVLTTLMERLQLQSFQRQLTTVWAAVLALQRSLISEVNFELILSTPMQRLTESLN